MKAVYSLLVVLLAVLASVVPAQAQLGRELQSRERRMERGERRARGFSERTRRPRGSRGTEEVAAPSPPTARSATPTTPTPAAEPTEPACPSILELVAGSDDLATLAIAVEAAGLVDAVADKTAVLTVLAPTDAAFEKVPAETLEALLADTEALTSVLGLHIIEGAVKAADLTNVTEAETTAGMIMVDTTDGVKFTGPNNGSMATVVEADIMSCAGVVHKIDTVIVPGEA